MIGNNFDVVLKIGDSGFGFLLLTFSLFWISFISIFILRYNLIIVLMSIEILFLSISLNFVFISNLLEDLVGQIAALVLLTVAAAESVIALSIIVSYYKLMYESETLLVD